MTKPNASVSKDMSMRSWKAVPPPDVVVDYSPSVSRRYIGSPSIALLAKGDYVVSHDFFGSGTDMDRAGETVVFRSRNRGNDWSKVAALKGQFLSSLFVHDDANCLTFHRIPGVLNEHAG